MQSVQSSIFAIDRKIIVCLILVISILAIYGKVRHYEFNNFDDNVYVSDNAVVRSGLNPASFRWSFSYTLKDGNYWHPLTWLSHMLDVSLYGMDAGRHHLVNVFFHIISTLLLFLAFNQMTGSIWRSAFVAALFALHPINVESVAWVAERKNVLSTFFWMLTLLAYSAYQQRPGGVRYLLVVLAFGLGLLAKPMLVTLPFVLLLLDYWPFKRIEFQSPIRTSFGTASRLILEKLPLFILSVLSVYVSSASVQGMGNVLSFEDLPLNLRLANGLVAYVKYIGKFIFPYHLAVYYPFPEQIPLWQPLTALALLLFISIYAFFTLKQKPYLMVGWLWYLGTLIPVIGLVQVGLWPEMADRWAYVPLIGLFVMLAWGVPDIFMRWRYKRILLVCFSGTALTALLFLSHIQIGHWRDSITLFEHGIRVTGGTWNMHNNLADALNKQGRSSAAIRHFYHALKLDPPEPEGVYYNLAVAFTALGRHPEAIQHYSEALKINSNYTAAHINLGAVFAKQGNITEATHHYHAALRLEPDSYQANFNLGNILLAQGKSDGAISRFSKALNQNPYFAESFNGMGLALMQSGKLEEAIVYFRKAANMNPAYLDAQKNQKLAEINYGKIRKAVAEMRDSMNFDHQDPEIDLKMIELLEKKKRLDQAVTQLSKALSLQPGFTSLDHNRISIVLDVKKKYEAKLAQFHEIIERWPDNAAADYHIACIYARRGQIDNAIKWLNQAIQKGFQRWDLIKTDSDLNGVRGSKDFEVLVKG